MGQMKLLDGRELAGFIKERQAHQVRALRQAHGVKPRLAIVVCKDDPVIAVYVALKQRYGADILVDVEVHKIDQSQALPLIAELNARADVHGIIVQLPLADTSQTDEICDAVAPNKDVDALGKDATLDPATPMAILWLLAGYNIDLRGKDVLLVGKGRLVGAPLEKILRASAVSVRSADQSTKDLAAEVASADVLITATGCAGIVKPDMIKPGVVIVDAGVASENGKTVGDVDPAMYDRDDITITPTKGGVGPLTVCALFENVLRAARESIESK